MTGKKTPPPPKAQAFDVQSANFDELKTHFDKTGCDADAYAVATWMYSRFPEESKKLLPLIKDADVNYKQGRASVPAPQQAASAPADAASATDTASSEAPVKPAPVIIATTDEWASALTAAKKLKDSTKGLSFETITEEQVHDKASKIYQNTRAPDTGCRAL